MYIMLAYHLFGLTKYLGVFDNTDYICYNALLCFFGDDMVSTGMTKLNVHVEDDSIPR